MAEFITTQAEKDAASYLAWDDAALGKWTKQLALIFSKVADDLDGLHRITACACAMQLVSMCIESNATKLSCQFENFMCRDLKEGDWVVTIERIDGADRRASTDDE